VVRSTKVTEAILAAGALKLVVRAGAGYNTIDVAAASRRGIYVSNCPGKNSVAVAELAFALILALDRRIADNVVRCGRANGTRRSFRRPADCWAARWA
jgi:D-3-phosphoglycerate dehydrogenase